MIENYEHEKHFDMLTRWLAAHGIAPVKSLLSYYGLVVDGIAIGFLFAPGNSQTAYIDNVAADPASDEGARDEALKKLFLALEAEARLRGLSVITALGSVDKMRRRFDELGYTNHGLYTLHFKFLEDKKCLG